ncbi:MAG: regulatory protein GemA [Phycisphaeraceae bacterium]
MTAADLRRRELAAIHAAKRDLGLDEDTYRAMLEQVTGQRSAGALDRDQRRAVLDVMRQRGAARVPRQRVAQQPGTPHNMNRRPMLAKIEAQLADMKLSWAYADAIARQQTGIARVAWVKKPADLSAIIAALEVEQTKRALLARVDERLAELGKTRDEIKARYELPGRWDRSIKVLRAVLEWLGESAD